MLKNEKNDKMREEEKKKAEEIMSLNVNMKEKIDQLKRNYTDSNNDRISAITQLTMLQNSQLTNELEYQSQKADKSLHKNTALQEKIYNSQRDIDIHKEVENKLAKNAKDLYKKYQEIHVRTKNLENEQMQLLEQMQERSADMDSKEVNDQILMVEDQIEKLTQD